MQEQSIYEDFGARSRYLKAGKNIAAYNIMWDTIIYTCLGYLLLARNSSYMIVHEVAITGSGAANDMIGIMTPVKF